jgi:hypothetical protein
MAAPRSGSGGSDVSRLAGTRSASDGSTLPAAWPLVGRGDEVALALESLQRRGCVILAGASGVGKTRLAREVLAAGASGGAPPQWVAATRSAATMALGAFAHLVPGESLAIGEGQDRRAVIFDTIVRAIEHHSAQGRPVVGVDDAHLLDDASATLVHLLVTAGAARVVVTVRSGEPTPDPVVALWKDELALRIEVQPLSRLEVSDLLGATLRGPSTAPLLAGCSTSPAATRCSSASWSMRGWRRVH